jgi:hypothetical protein
MTVSYIREIYETAAMQKSLREQAIDTAVRRVWDASNFIGRQIMARMAQYRDIPICETVCTRHLKRDVAAEFHKIMGTA